MIIATKTGDKGMTSLYKCRVSKSDIRIEALGSLDETSASIGLCRVLVGDEAATTLLRAIQKDLILIMGLISGYGEKEPSLATIDTVVERLQKLPELEQKDWVLYGEHDNNTSAHFDYASKVCRRAERALYNMEVDSVTVSPLIKQYINRLSDLLYLLARAYDYFNEMPV